MKRYSLTSESFTGEVIFVFNDFNLLESFDTTGAQLSEKQQVFLLKSLPRDLAELQNLITKSISAKITEINSDITFDQFWKRYNPPPLSKKKKNALPRWNRMSQTERNKAYYFIAKYELKRGFEGKMYAETYLNSEIWND
jgi:hypothetical protein